MVKLASMKYFKSSKGDEKVINFSAKGEFSRVLIRTEKMEMSLELEYLL